MVAESDFSWIRDELVEIVSDWGEFLVCAQKWQGKNNKKRKTFKTSSRRSEANFKQIHSSSTRDEKSCRLWQSSSKKRKRFIICSASWQWKLNNFRLFFLLISSSSSFSGFLSRCRMHGIFKVSRVLESYKFYGLFHSFHLCWDIWLLSVEYKKEGKLSLSLSRSTGAFVIGLSFIQMRLRWENWKEKDFEPLWNPSKWWIWYLN